MLLWNMKWTSAILVILFSVTQGRVVHPSLRIVNGTDVKIGEIPFQVSLQDNTYGSLFCGGSILNENYVITAAHCVDFMKSLGNDSRVVVGTVMYKEPGEVRKPADLIMHENYNPDGSHENDIGLIKLDAPLNFTELVKPVPLPDFHQKVPAGTAVVVSGWGARGGHHGDASKRLQKAQIWIADQDYCNEVMQDEDVKILPTQICANDPKSRRGQCHGDSGGPLTLNGTLVGIVSWSIKDPFCASTKYPGVYTRVSEYIDWIQKHAV